MERAWVPWETLLKIADGIAYGSWWGKFGQSIEETEDAYVAGNVVHLLDS